MRGLKSYNLRPSPQLMMPWHPGVTVSTERAAELLGCSRMTIVRMIDDGTLEAFRMRKNKPNSPWRVIHESIVRVSQEWKEQSGVTSRASEVAHGAQRTT